MNQQKMSKEQMVAWTAGGVIGALAGAACHALIGWAAVAVFIVGWLLFAAIEGNR